MNHHATVPAEYARAANLFAEMHRLRRLGDTVAPPPPLKRSDVALLGMLMELKKQGKSAVTIGRLAHLLRQSPPAISQKVATLEECGYLKRSTDKADRRRTYIELTPKGVKMTQRAVQQFFSRMEAALQHFGDDKTEALTTLMRELGDVLEDVGQDAAPPAKDAP